MPQKTPDTDALADALEQHAEDSTPATRAAVSIITNHRTWLTRDDFRRHIHSDNPHEPTVAWPDWDGIAAALDAGKLPCSRSEEQMLRLALSLTTNISIRLRDALSGLDGHNTGTVAGAVAIALHH